MIDFAFDFTGRRVLVTGGTRGTGLAIARAFQTAGAAVTITGTKILPSLYDDDLSPFEYAQVQLTNAAAIDRFLGQLGDVDVLVHAAGARIPRSWDESEREFVAHSARLGLVGPARLTTRMRYRLTSRPFPGGVVVHTGATRRWYELTRSPAEAHQELVSQTRRLGTTWARHGARVNTVVEAPAVQLPAPQRTPRVDVPLPARGRPGDVAAVVMFLASSGGAAISGETIPVSAGHDAPLPRTGATRTADVATRG